jgi:phosphatidylinositol-3-phosphatase
LAPTARRFKPLSRLSLFLCASLAILAAVLAFVFLGRGDGKAAAAAQCGGATNRASAASTRARRRPPHLKRVVVIMFENKEYNEVIGSSQAPTFNRLARHGALFTRYCGVGHPSLPNYLALVSGSTHGITDDCTDCSVSGRNLADTLGRAGLTWKSYAEGLPHRGFTGAEAGRYAKKHNPFVYFDDIVASKRRLARVVPLTRFHRDLRRGALPNLAFVVPNLCHDMHDCSVADGDHWLATFIRPLLRSRQLKHGVVFIVFDEGSEGDVSGGGGHTIALAVGPTVKRGTRVRSSLSHYNLLRTVEDVLRLPHLGSSSRAHPIRGIWR